MREFDDEDLRSWLERSGRLFQNCSCFVAAVGAFSRLLRAQPTSPKAWYGLAEALFCLSGQESDGQESHLDLLGDAVSCAKSSLQGDPPHELASELMDTMAREAPLSRDQMASAEAFSAVPTELSERVGYTDLTFAEAMLQIPLHGQRMQVVMWLGILDEPCGREILLTALDDSNLDVRMAALKRLKASDDARIVAKVKELASSEAGRSCEPYLSMALTRFARSGTESGHWAVHLLESIKQEAVPPQQIDLRFLAGRPGQVN